MVPAKAQRRKVTKATGKIVNVDAFVGKLFAPLRLCGKVFSSPLPPRAENDYATHVPILIGLAGIRRVERVLELGCGNYSTKTFLNRSAFPHLKTLQSFENDDAWANTIRTDVAHDSRCSITSVTGAMADAVSTLDLESFDLIFIDDSTTSEQRAATIRSLSVLH